MHKPLAQALVIIAAAAVASDEPSSGRRLAARRGRRRPVKRETESSHGLKESTPQLGKRAAPDGKTRFMLLSTQRSGTHYVMHELRRHPDVYTYTPCESTSCGITRKNEFDECEAIVDRRRRLRRRLR